jgi:PAS domain S-box-containing protein
MHSPSFSPNDTDHNTERAARILRRLLPLLVLSALIQGLLFTLNTAGTLRLIGLLAITGVPLLLAGLYYLVTRRQVRLCGLLLTGGLWLSYTGIGLIAPAGDLPALTGYMLVITLAGVLLSRSGVLLILFLSTLSGLVIHVVAERGLLALESLMLAYEADFIFYLFNLLLLGALIYLFLQEMSRADRERAEAHSDHAEQTLARRRAESMLSRLTNALPMVVYSINSDGIFELSEGAGLQKLSLESGGLVGKNAFDFYADYPDVIQAIQQALQGETVRYTTHINDRHFENYYHPVPDGDSYRLFGISYDISEHHRVEQELIANALRFQKLIANLPEIMLLVRAQNGRVIFNNQGALAGHKLAGCNLWELLNDHALPKYAEVIEMHRDSLLNDDVMQIPVIEYALRSSDGDVEWIRSRGVVLERDEDSGQPDLLLFTLTVFTEEREAEIAVRDSREQLEVIFNESLDVICLIGEDERIMRVNRTVEDVLGYEPDEVVGEHFSMLLPPENAADSITRTDDANLYETIPFVRADGSICKMELTATIVHWQNDFSILLTLRDVNKREEMRSAMLQAEKTRAEMQRERDRMKAREDIIFVIAHQLRNPLSVIQLSADFINRYFARLDAKRRAEHLEKILSQTAYLNKMMTNMLTAREALMGGLKADPEAANPGEICRAIFEQVRIARGTPQHTFIYNDETRTSFAMLDETLVTYVIENLMSNAVKYSPDGGDIRMTLTEADDRYIITVSDEGIGIPEDSQQEIFGMFQRADNVKGIRGTGIGLGLAYNAVEAHGGTLSFESVEGAGSTFTVTLPIVRPDAFTPTSGLPESSSV